MGNLLWVHMYRVIALLPSSVVALSTDLCAGLLCGEAVSEEVEAEDPVRGKDENFVGLAVTDPAPSVPAAW